MAKIFGVNLTTIYHWLKPGIVRIEPLHQQLTLQLVGISTAPMASAYGAALRNATDFGPAYALHVLLSIAFDDWRPTDAA